MVYRKSVLAINVKYIGGTGDNGQKGRMGKRVDFRILTVTRCGPWTGREA